MRAFFIAAISAALGSVLLGSPQSGHSPAWFVIQTFHNPVTVTPLYHASFLLEEGNKAIYIDPAHPANFAKLPHADMIVITAPAESHLDARAIAEISTPGTTIIAPASAVKSLGRGHALAAGEITNSLGWFITAVASVEDSPGSTLGQSSHQKEEHNGYVLTYGSKSFYVSGETASTAAMRALKGIDVAFVSIDATRGISAQELADAVKAIHPALLVPYAYRGSDPRRFAKGLEGTGIQVKLADWYAEPASALQSKR